MPWGCQMPSAALWPLDCSDHALLHPEGVAEYCSRSARLRVIVGAHPEAQVLVGGVMNRVYKVSGSGRALLVKVAPPFCYMRPSLKVTQVRQHQRACAESRLTVARARKIAGLFHCRLGLQLHRLASRRRRQHCSWHVRSPLPTYRKSTFTTSSTPSWPVNSKRAAGT